MKLPQSLNFQDDAILKKYRLMELYSGIGGMRYAIEAAGIPFEIVAAFDINPFVNKIYCHNFGFHHLSRNILSLTAAEVECLKVDIITLSPPCQPFTRVGLKRDIEDERTNSFLHVLNVISELQKKPLYLILENVQGFENSQTRKKLIETLKKSGYRYQEFLLSPKDFGIPNSRLRYYIIAKQQQLPFSFDCVQQVLFKMPKEAYSWTAVCEKCCQQQYSASIPRCSVGHFLEEKPEEYFSSFLISDDALLKHWTVFDMVNKSGTNSCCFTKAYRHYAQGTGSVLFSVEDSEVSDILSRVTSTNVSEDKLALLKKLQLRYFTPKEIANIMCFPKQFDFPEDVTIRQRYKALGNSLNVFVAACVIQLLFET
ncbi:tRNA (cytosine-5-)-methyltransferase-like isoform X2 [Stegodyphus dumicola]|nr:tRNA (cytosine-5-)-methyltransferase-like isoform X2 [Stegodyphus dumicola]XP_035210069.1 tRNA (cytosine-5-)-methyltransferase-like isoform X2 [Stegodyphus dumicola]